MNSSQPIPIFQTYDPLYAARGYATIPVVPAKKRASPEGWAQGISVAPAVRDAWRREYASHGIGILAGTPLSTGRTLCFLDIDQDGFVPFVQSVLGEPCSAKFGSKGLTIFAQASLGLKSRKLRARGEQTHAVEVFVSSGMTVLPPSIHPSGRSYNWRGRPLLEVEHHELPTLDEERFAIIEAVARSPHAWEIVKSGPEVKGHEPMLTLTASGIADLTDDPEWLAECLNALFHPEYTGNTRDETLAMLLSAKEKGLGRRKGSGPYDPGAIGPIPLGFTRDGNYALRDQVRNIVLLASAQQLLSMQYLLGLCGSEFWAAQFPAKKAAFDSMGAGEALIAAAKRQGPFNPMTVRGRGIWREGDRIVVNLGAPVPEDVKHLYLCFEPIPFGPAAPFDASRLLRFLQLFNWRNPQDAMLLLGWLALAPICGVLNWRPHCFLYGPPRCGKTTIHTLAAQLLRPLVISTDGQSSEAGIRQTLGPDSLPVIIDEFESDQSGASLKGVLRLARSASSAENPVLRGTPEGKAMQFSLRTSFFFCAVNPSHMSQADQTRILLLELKMHASDHAVAQKIVEEESYFASLGSAWAAHMVSSAAHIAPALEILEKVMPSSDRRHRQNMATLLAASFVALNGRPPAVDEAKALAREYTATVELHAEEAQRDDAMECLDFLLSHVVDDYPLGHWLGAELKNTGLAKKNKNTTAARIASIYQMMIRADGDNQPGLYIRNGSPQVEKLFEGTRWGGAAWQKALRKIEGVIIPRDPVHFPAGKSRCVVLPLDLVPEPFEDVGKF